MTRETIINVRRPLSPTLGKPRDLKFPETFDPHLDRIRKFDVFDDFLRRDEIDVPDLVDREGYFPGEDYKYWMTGLGDYFTITNSLPSPLPNNASILDFGGCTGRVSRHFLAATDQASATIAEVNINYVEWVNTHGGRRFKGSYLGGKPKFKIPDDSFDLAFGISVFTHIDQHEMAWIKELSRVVRPGGYIYLTFLSENSWEQMDRELLGNVIKAEHKENKSLADAIGGKMPLERFSVRLEFNDAVNNSNTFHSSDYIKRAWGKIATVVKINHSCHSYQSAVVLLNDKKGKPNPISFFKKIFKFNR
jgi:SAM-dependent methyltransferase